MGVGVSRAAEQLGRLGSADGAVTAKHPSGRRENASIGQVDPQAFAIGATQLGQHGQHQRVDRRKGRLLDLGHVTVDQGIDIGRAWATRSAFRRSRRVRTERATVVNMTMRQTTPTSAPRTKAIRPAVAEITAQPAGAGPAWPRPARPVRAD